MMNRIIQLILFAGLSLPVNAVSATSFTQIIILGDSLSDTGRLFNATNVPPNPPYFQGRLSNGPIWVDQLEQQLNLPVVNFAIAGATTGFDNVNDDLAPGLNLDGMGDQLNTFLNQQTIDPDALHIVWGGANNFSQLPADPLAAISTGVTELVTLVGTLSAQGAQHILVINLPNLGLSPRLVNTQSQAGATALSVAFNQALANELSKLGLDIIQVDIFTTLNQVAETPGNFGLSVIDQKCLDLSTLIPCANPEDYFFWDDLHPTTAGHSIIANQIFSAIEKMVTPTSAGAIAIPALTPAGHTVLIVSLFGLALWNRRKFVPRNESNVSFSIRKNLL